MSDPEIRYQALLGKLKKRGSRITSHRLALLRLISVSEGHPNAAKLYETLLVQFPTISLATIYKTLALLKEEGEILEIDLHNDSRYDGNKPYPHPHLVCTICGKIADGDSVQFTHNINHEILDLYHFKVASSQILFYGVCADCLE